jgi:transcriptional regulator with XRE-family HTH domain
LAYFERKRSVDRYTPTILAVMPRQSTRSSKKAPQGEETLGERLARLRKAKGLTQVELAEKMGIIQVLVSDYERGKLRPNPEILIGYARALDVTTDELVGVAPSKKIEPPSISRRFVRRLEKIEKLPKRDQDALIRTIDAFLGKAS